MKKFFLLVAAAFFMASCNAGSSTTSYVNNGNNGSSSAYSWNPGGSTFNPGGSTFNPGSSTYNPGGQGQSIQTNVGTWPSDYIAYYMNMRGVYSYNIPSFSAPSYSVDIGQDEYGYWYLDIAGIYNSQNDASNGLYAFGNALVNTGYSIDTVTDNGFTYYVASAGQVAISFYTFDYQGYYFMVADIYAGYSSGQSTYTSTYTYPSTYTSQGGMGTSFDTMVNYWPSNELAQYMSDHGIYNYNIPTLSAYSYEVFRGYESSVEMFGIAGFYQSETEVNNYANAYLNALYNVGYQIQQYSGSYVAVANNVTIMVGAYAQNGMYAVALAIYAGSMTSSTYPSTYTSQGGMGNSFDTLVNYWPTNEIAQYMSDHGIYSYNIPTLSAYSYEIFRGYESGVEVFGIAGFYQNQTEVSNYLNNYLTALYNVGYQVQQSSGTYVAMASNYSIMVSSFAQNGYYAVVLGIVAGSGSGIASSTYSQGGDGTVLLTTMNYWPSNELATFMSYHGVTYYNIPTLSASSYEVYWGTEGGMEMFGIAGFYSSQTEAQNYYNSYSYSLYSAGYSIQSTQYGYYLCTSGNINIMLGCVSQNGVYAVSLVIYFA